MDLLIIGAGAFSTETEEMARLLGYDNIVFLDDNPDKALAHPIIGTIGDLDKFRDIYDNAIVSMGNNELRIRFHEQLEKNGYTIPSLIHPTAYVSPDADLAPGCIVRAFAVVGRYAKLGKATILNIGAKVDHHCVIGEGSHLLINAVVRASKTVESLTWMEAGQVLQ